MGVTAVPLGKSVSLPPSSQSYLFLMFSQMPQDVESYFLSSEMIVQRTEDGNQKLHVRYVPPGAILLDVARR